MSRKTRKSSSQRGSGKTQPPRPWVARALTKTEIAILIPATADYVSGAMKAHQPWVWTACALVGAIVFAYEFLTARASRASSGEQYDTPKPYAPWAWRALVLVGLLAILHQFTTPQAAEAPLPASTGGAGLVNLGGGKVVVNGNVIGGDAAVGGSKDSK